MKKTYEMNGKTYKTLTAMAKELGISRLYTKDFEKYGIKEVTEDDVTTQSVDVATTDTTVATITNSDTFVATITTDTTVATVATIDSDVATTVDTDATIVDGSTKIGADIVDTVITNDVDDKAVDTVDTDTTVATVSDTVDAAETTTDTTVEVDPVEELEKDVVDLTFEEFGKRLKKIDNNGILKMSQNIQGNTWDEISDPRIKRMRMIMEIKAAYYPDSVKKSVSTKAGKKASPWKAISTDDLVKAAADKKLSYKDCDDLQIKRMRVIMALKAAGVTAESLTK